MGVFFDADDDVPLFQQGQRGVADTAADFQGSRIAVEAVGHPSVVALVQMAFGIHTPVLDVVLTKAIELIQGAREQRCATALRFGFFAIASFFAVDTHGRSLSW
ncbi:hypothetical protein D3C81_1690140 [compost metagenome]